MSRSGGWGNSDGLNNGGGEDATINGDGLSLGCNIDNGCLGHNGILSNSGDSAINGGGGGVGQSLNNWGFGGGSGDSHGLRDWSPGWGNFDSVSLSLNSGSYSDNFGLSGTAWCCDGNSWNNWGDGWRSDGDSSSLSENGGLSWPWGDASLSVDNSDGFVRRSGSYSLSLSCGDGKSLMVDCGSLCDSLNFNWWGDSNSGSVGSGLSNTADSGGASDGLSLNDGSDSHSASDNLSVGDWSPWWSDGDSVGVSLDGWGNSGGSSLDLTVRIGVCESLNSRSQRRWGNSNNFSLSNNCWSWSPWGGDEGGVGHSLGNWGDSCLNDGGVGFNMATDGGGQSLNVALSDWWEGLSYLCGDGLFMSVNISGDSLCYNGDSGGHSLSAGDSVSINSGGFEGNSWGNSDCGGDSLNNWDWGPWGGDSLLVGYGLSNWG